MADMGHNSSSGVTDDYLVEQVKKIAAIEDEIGHQRQDINETLKIMKSSGYDVPMVRQLVKDYRANPEDIQAREATRRMYLEKMGIPV